MEGRRQLLLSAGATKASKSTLTGTYHWHRMVAVHSFGLDFVVDAHDQGWQFHGVVQRAL